MAPQATVGLGLALLQRVAQLGRLEGLCAHVGSTMGIFWRVP